jgi:tetratricopeptide (TPR) repeat protein
MAESAAGEYSAALRSFEAFFKAGGSGVDAQYSYARTLREVQQPDAAIGWYYRTVQANPRLLDVTQELVESLIQQRRYDEALGVVGGFVGLLPNYKEYWAPTLTTIDAATEGSRASAAPAKQSTKIPAIGQHHWAPIRVDRRNLYDFALVDTGATYVVLPERLAQREIKAGGRDLVRVQTAAGVLELPKVTLSDLFVGSVHLRKVEAVVCDDCGILLGRSALLRFDTRTIREHDTEFLVLTARH